MSLSGDFNKNKRLTLRSHEAKTLEKNLFSYSLMILDVRGGGQNTLFKAATKQYLRLLMMLDFDA